jgi:hypothetical protein
VRPPGLGLPLLWAAFIAYGSLVPLDFQPATLAEGWARFQRIPWLDLGVENRADWIANGVLYAVLGFLAVRALAARWGAFGALLALAGCTGLALGVEFAQLYFPPRTVSLNDLLAEGIGTALGALAVPFAGPWARRLRAGAQRGGRLLTGHLLELYGAAYLVLCFFPFDLLLSRAELAAKLAGGLWSWTLLLDRGWGLALIQLAVEAALVAPLGALLALRGHRAGAAAVALGAGAGALLGLLVEAGQLLLASGVSQGASVLARAVGMGIGAALAARLAAGGLDGLRTLAARLLPWLMPAWAAAAVFVSGWTRGAWGGWPQAQATLAELRWVPFYYHYWTTEAIALFSLGVVSLMYLPLALLGWARRWPTALSVVLVALAVAVVEAGKLFVAGQRPDPTNLLIAPVAAWALLRLLAWVGRVGRVTGGPRSGADAAGPYPVASAASGAAAVAAVAAGVASAPGAGPAPRAGARRPGGPAAVTTGRTPGWVALLGLPPALWGAWTFPVGGLALALLLLAAAALVWWRPVAALVLLPAALPLLDLTPWSGRFFWTEFDLLALVVLGVAAWRTGGAPAWARPASGLAPLFALLGLSLAASSALALAAALPPAGPFWAPYLAPDALAHYRSPWNALRVAKGALWAWAFVVVVQRVAAADRRWRQALGAGMVLALAGLVGWVVWERYVFTGLWDFAVIYRVTGPISAMHRGGGFIECALAVTAAFALGWALHARRLAGRVAALVLLAGAAYAVMVTYSRNGYAAFGAVLLAVPLLWALQARGRRLQRLADEQPFFPDSEAPAAAPPRPVGGGAGRSRPGLHRLHRWRAAGWALLALGVAAAVAWPVFSGPFAQQRLASWEQDLAVRQAHWADAVRMREPGALPALLGEGLGRFPELHFWRSREPVRAGDYRLRHDPDGRAFLRLAPGATLYVEQIVSRPPGQQLRLAADVRVPADPLRSGAAGATGAAALEPARTVSVGAGLCEKSMLTSAICLEAPLRAQAEPGRWVRVEAVIDTQTLTAPPPPRGPQVKLSVFTPGSGAGAALVDVARLSLRGDDGQELLANGDFAAGLDRWFFSTDIKPPWHVDNLAVAVWLEQGWLGVLALGLLAAAALLRGLGLAWRGQAAMPQALAAALAFLVVGALNTLVDEPRFLMLLLVLLWLAALPRPPRPPHPPPVSSPPDRAGAGRALGPGRGA